MPEIGAARPDHRYARCRVVDELKQRCRNPGQTVKNDEPRVPHRILYVVSEDPEIKHVSAEMKEASMEEHRCKYSQHVVGQQFRAPLQREEKLLRYESVLDDELLPPPAVGMNAA